ncbi:MAG: DEAD/DEAH box helicase [Bacteroidota bacterium]
MNKQLAEYFKKLKFLPGNNRSLLLLDLPENHYLDLKTLDLATNNSSFSVIESVVSRSEKIRIPEISQNDATFHRQLMNIANNEQFIFEERGGKDLYIGWPFVRGKLKDGTLVRCPFIFFPYSLVQEDNEWFLEKRKDVNITLNKTFLLRYAYHNKTTLNEELIEKILNDFNTDVTLFRSELYSLLKDSELDIEFNQRNFIDELEPFKSFKIEELEANESNGKLRLYPYATLGIFPQAGAYLITDYEKLLETTEGNFFSTLGKKITIEESIDAVKQVDMHLPFPIDGYQERAFKHVKIGESVVIEGPSGTGKSQLISSVMGDYMAQGKSVLLVSQKAVALKEAYKRLQELQLHPFVGFVHDFKNDRQNIYDQIIRQIQNLSEYRQKNISPDTQELEKVFHQCSETIDHIISTLNEYKEALFDDNECGKPIKELYLLTDKQDARLPLNQVYRNYKFDKVEKFIPVLARYMENHRRFEVGEHFWAKGPSLSKVKKVDAKKFSSILDEIYELEQHIKDESRKFTKNEIDFETALFFLANKEPLEQLAENLENDTTYSFYVYLVDQSPDQDIGWLSQKERNLLQCFKGAGPEISLPSSDLGRFQEALEHAIKARKGIISWIRWRLFSEDKIFITRVLVANDLKSNKVGFETLLERIDNRLNFEHLVSEIKEVNWLKDFPDSYRKIDIQNWFFYQKLALKSYQLRHTIRTLPNYLLAKNETLENYTKTIQLLVDLINQIPPYLEKWKSYVNEAQVRYLLLGKTDRSKVEKQLQEDLNDILIYHEIRDSFSEEELKLIDDLCELEYEGKGLVEQLFISSISSAWIDHIEQKFPILKMATTQEMEKNIEELQSNFDEKIRISRDLILTKAREKAVSATAIEGTEASYEDLQKLLNDSKKKWPIRRVINQFEEEIFSLLPCWVTTPESASAIFPMKQIFDLVIFDEATLCLAERGIPALLRSTCWMVIGDNNQLSQNNIYDDEILNQQDASDSVYNFMINKLASTTLRRNYYMRDQILLDFSNRHFYNDELKLIPDFSIKSEHGIILHQVDGTWSTKGNEKEAHEVVRLVDDSLKKSPQESLGVVVTNKTQGSLIMNLLAEKKIKLPQSFFIKTIEQTQGIVRDEIIVSLSYSKWEHFESFSKKMVNLFSTRGKKMIHLISSLNTNDRIEDDGLQLLAAYLKYAKDNKSMIRNTTKEGDLNTYLFKKSLNNKFLSSDLPFTDCAIKKKEKYKGAILTEDHLKDQNVLDAFYNNYNLLREKKWPFIQFFTREFWEHKTASFDKLDRFIDRET